MVSRITMTTHHHHRINSSVACMGTYIATAIGLNSLVVLKNALCFIFFYSYMNMYRQVRFIFIPVQIKIFPMYKHIDSTWNDCFLLFIALSKACSMKSYEIHEYISNVAIVCKSCRRTLF